MIVKPLGDVHVIRPRFLSKFRRFKPCRSTTVSTTMRQHWRYPSKMLVRTLLHRLELLDSLKASTALWNLLNCRTHAMPSLPCIVVRSVEICCLQIPSKGKQLVSVFLWRRVFERWFLPPCHGPWAMQTLFLSFPSQLV
jgi:hypothetical protein